MSKPLTIRVLVALQRARVVAKRDFNRALGYLIEARVQFAAAVRFCIAAAAVATLTACGGGDDSLPLCTGSADSPHPCQSNTQPVACVGITGLSCQ